VDGISPGSVQRTGPGAFALLMSRSPPFGETRRLFAGNVDYTVRNGRLSA
jgi:hypothetical protein